MIKLKGKINTREMSVLGVLAVLFTAVYLISDFLPIFLEFSMNIEGIRNQIDYDSVAYISWLLRKLLPIVVLLSWYMYIERYVNARKQYYEQEYYSRGKKTEISTDVEFPVIVKVILGVTTFLEYQDLKYFLAKNWNILDGLKLCGFIKFVLLIISFTFLVVCIRNEISLEMIDWKNARVVRIGTCFFTFLILATLASDIYSTWISEKVYDQKRTEYYSENSEAAEIFRRTSSNFFIYLGIDDTF